jgi:hypothetical protein
LYNALRYSFGHLCIVYKTVPTVPVHFSYIDTYIPSMNVRLIKFIETLGNAVTTTSTVSTTPYDVIYSTMVIFKYLMSILGDLLLSLKSTVVIFYQECAIVLI